MLVESLSSPSCNHRIISAFITMIDNDDDDDDDDDNVIMLLYTTRDEKIMRSSLSVCLCSISRGRISTEISGWIMYSTCDK